MPAFHYSRQAGGKEGFLKMVRSLNIIHLTYAGIISSKNY